MEWSNDNEYNIIGISETNLDSMNSKNFSFFHKDRFNLYFSERDNKVKGSGVAIAIDKKWDKHKGTISSPNPYIIQADLYFKDCTIHIIQVYCPPNDLSMQKTISKYIRDHEKKYKKRNLHRTIIMGDFNFIMDRDLDRK
jgi:exonuclease III